MTFSHAVAPALVAKLPYDTLKQLAPVRQTTQASLLFVVRSDAPWRSIGELIAAAKAQPGRLSYGSSGSGSPTHLGGEVFKLATGADLLHVPFKGGPPATNAILAQQVDVLCTSAPHRRRVAALGQDRARGRGTAGLIGG